MIEALRADVLWNLLERRVTEDRERAAARGFWGPIRVVGWCSQCRRTGCCDHIQVRE